MRNRLLAVTLLLLLALNWASAPATAATPDWVPEQYRQYFHRSAGNTQGWKTALDQLGMNFGNVGGSFALVVGVSKYPNMAGDAADLAPARFDVEKMVSYVESAPENFDEVVVLLDDQVTSGNLEYFLTNYFPQRLRERPGSRFLFAYSGHGMTEQNGRGYLLTSKAKSLQDRFGVGASIPMITVRAQLQEIVDSGFQVLVLINSCYSADFHKMSINFGADKPSRPNEPGAHVITGGGTGEQTWHDPTFGDGSIFFEAVIAALEGRADTLPQDGIVSIGELETYLKAVITQFTDKRQHPRGGDLQSRGSLGGFFFFDRATMINAGIAPPLVGDWWSQISFGRVADVTGPDQTNPEPPVREATVEENLLPPGAAIFYSSPDASIAVHELLRVSERYRSEFDGRNPVVSTYFGSDYAVVLQANNIAQASRWCLINGLPCEARQLSFPLGTNPVDEGFFGGSADSVGWVELGNASEPHDLEFGTVGDNPGLLPVPGNLIISRGTTGMQYHLPGTRYVSGEPTPTMAQLGEVYGVIDTRVVGDSIWAKVVDLGFSSSFFFSDWGIAH